MGIGLTLGNVPLQASDVLNVIIGDIPPTPTPTQTNTQTPTQTNTQTPTQTPGINVTIINNSTGDVYVDSFQDSLGVITLQNEIGSFPITIGNTLYGYQLGTSSAPYVAIRGTSPITYTLVVNGVDILRDQTTNVPADMPASFASAPLTSTDIIVITIGDIPPTPTPTQTETPTQTPTNTETQTPTPTNTQTPTHTPGINFTLINNTTGGTVNFDGFYDGTSTPISLLSIVSGGGYSTGFPVSGGTILYATHGTTPSGPYVDVNGGFANYVVKLNNVVIASGGAINPGIAVTGGSGLLSTDIVEVTITND